MSLLPSASENDPEQVHLTSPSLKGGRKSNYIQINLSGTSKSRGATSSFSALPLACKFTFDGHLETRLLLTNTPPRLSSWTLPYEAFIVSIHKEVDKPSPFGPLGTTPDHVEIKSPIPSTPGREAAGPSPNMQLVYQKARENRATLFLQGRLEELVVSMCREDRK